LHTGIEIVKKHLFVFKLVYNMKLYKYAH